MRLQEYIKTISPVNNDNWQCAAIDNDKKTVVNISKVRLDEDILVPSGAYPVLFNDNWFIYCNIIWRETYNGKFTSYELDKNKQFKGAFVDRYYFNLAKNRIYRYPCRSKMVKLNTGDGLIFTDLERYSIGEIDIEKEIDKYKHLINKYNWLIFEWFSKNNESLKESVLIDHNSTGQYIGNVPLFFTNDRSASWVFWRACDVTLEGIQIPELQPVINHLKGS